MNKGGSEASVTVAGFGDLAGLGVDVGLAMLSSGREVKGKGCRDYEKLIK